MPVSGIPSLLPTSDLFELRPFGEPATVDGPFQQRLEAAIGRVSDVQGDADDALTRLGAGGDVDLHGSMIALAEAEIALKATVAVRDKVVAAYETLFNMAV